MKNIILIITAIVLANFSLQAKSIVTATNSSKFVQIQVENTGRNATISISDQEGIVLHSQDVITQNYTVSYDMQELPAGNYLLSVTEMEDNHISNTNYDLIIKNDLVFLGEAEEEMVFFPSIMQKDGYVFLNALALNTTTAITVQFTDAFNQTVHTDSFTASGSKGRVYSLEGLNPGVYTVSCYVEGQVIESTITVK